MHFQEKLAWFCLAFTAGPFALFCVLQLAGAGDASLAAFALVSPIAVTGIFGTRKKGKIILDERDNWILQQGTKAGFGLFWVAFVALCMAPFLLHGPEASVTLSVSDLQDILWASFTGVYVVRSLVIIYFYRKDSREANHH